ncbi:hypothetical protein [Bordetella bronchialis]|uniref:Cupin 2 conserved barrel domain-containing protein n=1 Tax=Bordetella bronchialis TaxID=463025 RepID=A0A193FTC1_9BORD|nr:hypothetical protein [Bordetella bronchialis]ANN70885.1 hypothetical protein BAU08_05655 [Bordetella bronchialis]
MKTIVDWLIRRAQRTPYTDISSADGTDVYMGRWWLFNPYGKDATGERIPPRWSWLPSIRLHHILRPDADRHLHDHPWNARTVILHGWYIEERENGTYVRRAGDTAAIRFEQYHRIAQVSPGGVWTLFITWRYRGTWGFKVDGEKIPWRDYIAGRPTAQPVPAGDLQHLADKVIITNATGNERLFLDAVRELLAAVRAMRTLPRRDT